MEKQYEFEFMRTMLLDKLKKMCPEFLDKTVKEKDSLKKDLDLDSTDVLELTMAIEGEYDIAVDDYISQSWKTVKDIIDFIEKELQEKEQRKKKRRVK